MKFGSWDESEGKLVLAKQALNPSTVNDQANPPTPTQPTGMIGEPCEKRLILKTRNSFISFLTSFRKFQSKNG